MLKFHIIWSRNSFLNLATLQQTLQKRKANQRGFYSIFYQFRTRIRYTTEKDVKTIESLNLPVQTAKGQREYVPEFKNVIPKKFIR